MGEVRTVGRIMAGWGTLDSRKKKQADHWLLRTSSLFCHCKCLFSSYLSPFPFFSDPLAFIHPPFLREPCPEHPVLSSSSWDTCAHRPTAVVCCLCSDWYYLCVCPWSWGAVFLLRPRTISSSPAQFVPPFARHRTEVAIKKKNSCWMTTWAPILEIKTRLMKVRSNLQSALLPSPTCSIISLFLALFSQMISHSFGGLGTSYSHKQNLVQCLYL